MVNMGEYGDMKKNGTIEYQWVNVMSTTFVIVIQNPSTSTTTKRYIRTFAGANLAIKYVGEIVMGN